MVSVLVSRAVDHWFKPQSGQIKDYNFSIVWFSAKYAAVRRKNRDWLAWTCAALGKTFLGFKIVVKIHSF
jgi:hypothetical protein